MVHESRPTRSESANQSAPTAVSSPFEFSGRIRSFKYAFRGISYLLRSQHNAWIHALATLAVLSAGLYFNLRAAEWCWIVLAITAVWTAEALNTAFELLADAITQEYHPLIGRAKDVAAGAVLLTAIGASIIGLIIFWPRLCTLLFGGQ
jgi:diacylglycerol kinase (ATP)